MQRTWIGVLLIALTVGGLSVTAAATNGPGKAAAERLAERMEDLERLNARFSQRLTDGRGIELRRTRGELWAERPDRFRWEVSAPFAEVLIGDGSTLWLWDPDLEQVTVRPYDDRLKATPARILSGAVGELVDAFDVDYAAIDETRERFTLWPRGGDALFERLEMIFEGQRPRYMIIHDGLGQRTEVELHDVRTDFAIDPDLFTFEIPEGADVIEEEAEYGLDG